MITIIPKYISARDWFASLIEDYPDVTMPILRSEKEWEKIGTIIAGLEVFARMNIPPPASLNKAFPPFKDWREWAMAVYNVVNFNQSEPAAPRIVTVVDVIDESIDESID